VTCGNVKHFVSDMVQEDDDLRGHDETAFTGGWVVVNRGGAIGGKPRRRVRLTMLRLACMGHIQCELERCR
jgi:hypothetical protein